MPFLIIGAIVIAVVFWTLGRRSSPPAQRSKCDWQATGNDTASLGEYRCKTCKVTAYATGGRAPQDCKRGMGGSL